MITNQPAYAIRSIVIEFQSAQNDFCHIRALHRVSLEVVLPRFVGCDAQRLCDIMKQHRKPQHLVRFYMKKRVKRMLSDRITMMLIVLIGLHHGIKLRQKYFRKSGLIHRPHRIRMGGSQKLDQLHLYPLRTYRTKILCKILNRRQCVRLNTKAKLRCKAHSTEHTKCILAKAVMRLANTSYDARRKILLSIKRIHKPRFIIVSHRIDREITPF